ncbi:HlyD family efflux transporter periplasmic adaptor subunit [Bengtsoniella intestinalis]|uniref:HlyD family efflux transporter periplasmic adaptor subunit n=1 Tax=Bengtsoniella intestinalis TaxID=3073143 RepID=UPI00391F7107
MKLAKPTLPKLKKADKAEKAPKVKGAKKKLTKKQIFKRVLLLALLIASCVGLYILFFVEEEAAALTETITYGSLATVLEGDGTSVPTETQTVTTASNADILEVAVTAGDYVSVGDLLYIQDDSDLDDSIYDYEVDIADEQINLADYYEAYYELIDSYNGANVRADFSGKIINVTVEEGKDVQKGSVMATLVDTSTMEVTQYFNYAYKDYIAVGTPVQVAVADQMMLITGSVKSIDYVDYLTAEGASCFAVTIVMDNPGSLTASTPVTTYITTASGMEIFPVESGELSYEYEEDIEAELADEVTGVYVKDYENVVAGQLLFTIDPDSVETQLESALSKIENSESMIESLEGFIEDIEESREEYEVYSEIDGLVIMVNVTTDRNPTNGQTAVVVYDTSVMEISANIDELDIDSIEMGMAVTLSYSSGSSTQYFDGSITEISYEATNSSGVAYFPVTIEIQSNGALSAGVNVSYSIAIGEEEEGYLVPIDGLKTIDDQTCVFVKADSKPDNMLETEDGVVPDGFYAVPVTVKAISSLYALIAEEMEEGVEVFTRYETTSPTGGDTTSDSGEETVSMDAMMMERESMMSSGMQSGMQSGQGGR